MSEPSEFSNAPWWIPPPPLKPPKPIPASRILVGTLLPLAAIALVVALVLTHRSGSPSVPSGRSAAGFQACVKAKGVDPSWPASPGALQGAMRSCASHLPPGTRLPDLNRPRRTAATQDAQQAFGQCMQTALSSLRPSGGFRGGNRTTIRNAETMCRAIAQGAKVPPATTATIPKTA